MSALLSKLTAALIGAVLGVALGVGRLTRPEVIVGWVDVLGSWDPTLLWFMLGSSAAFAPCHAWVKRRGAPLLACSLSLPQQTQIDRKLWIGATLFGVGWALGGVCPGPALTSLGAGAPWAALFVPAMALGLWLGSPERLARWRASAPMWFRRSHAPHA